MKRGLEYYTNRPDQEMLCTAEKERALVVIRKTHNSFHQPFHYKNQLHALAIPAVQLQDCSVSPSFWQGTI